MTGRKRSAHEWYSPYFAPSTVVVGLAVIIVSVQAGRYAGGLMMERDKARYAPVAVGVTQTVQPGTKSRSHKAPLVRLSPAAQAAH